MEKIATDSQIFKKVKEGLESGFYISPEGTTILYHKQPKALVVKKAYEKLRMECGTTYRTTVFV